MPRLKFSLRTLLSCTALVAVYLCAAQIRRQNILKMAEEFELDGATVRVDDAWIDAVWMRQPTDATINTTVLPDSFVRLGMKAYRSGDVQTESAALAQRLRAAGVETVRLVYDVGTRSELYSFTSSDANEQTIPWVRMRLPNQERQEPWIKRSGCDLD